MNETIVPPYVIYKQFRDTNYFVSKNGEVYSFHSLRVLKACLKTTRGMTYKYIDIRNKTTGRVQHINVHKMVYEAWVGPVPPNKVIRHLNDNSLDNRLSNLAIGDQADNIRDCILHGRRVGFVKKLIIKNKRTGEILTFCPALNIYEHFGLRKKGSLTRILQDKWFTNEYDVVSNTMVKSLHEL